MLCRFYSSILQSLALLWHNFTRRGNPWPDIAHGLGGSKKGAWIRLWIYNSAYLTLCRDACRKTRLTAHWPAVKGELCESQVLQISHLVRAYAASAFFLEPQQFGPTRVRKSVRWRVPSGFRSGSSLSFTPILSPGSLDDWSRNSPQSFRTWRVSWQQLARATELLVL